jgi:Beta-lactamase enzyme family
MGKHSGAAKQPDKQVPPRTRRAAHAPGPSGRRFRSRRGLPILLAGLMVVALGALVAFRVNERSTDVANQASDGQLGADESSAAAAASSASAAASAASASAAAVAAAAASASSASVSAAAASSAAEVSAIQSLANGRSASSISIAALNTSTGASYQWGATGGMLTGSIVKLYILETLLVQKQNTGGLSSSQRSTAVKMIENSDNSAAETLFEAVGGRTALLKANPTLGLKNTTPGPGDYWGLTQTCASDYITLLQNLVTPTGGPLNATSQAYVLGLMRSVEADQRWGVGVTADAGTDFANKNGWLAVDDDNDLWLVNSTGVVTIKGQQVLMVVLTQHDSDFQSGINLTQSLAQALVPLVT